MDPMQRFAIDWIADNPGKRALHFHKRYHTQAGVMRAVEVS